MIATELAPDNPWREFNGLERFTPFEPVLEPYPKTGKKTWGLHDSIYGEVEFTPDDEGDRMLIDLMHAEQFRRLKFISQLTLPPHIQTKPEIGDFNRFEHSIGTMLLGRNFGGTIEQQARSLYHDLGHLNFSHLMEWMSAEIGANEEEHEARGLTFARWPEIAEILTGGGFTPEQIAGTKVVDFTERPKPDLCSDRLDYGLREFARWTNPHLVPSILGSLSVDHEEQQYVFDDDEIAYAFADNFLRLAPENWYLPTNMFKQNLLLETLRYTIKRGYAEIGELSKTDMHTLNTIEFRGGYLQSDQNIWNALDLLNNNRSEQIELDVRFVPQEEAHSIDEETDNTILLPHNKLPFRHVDPRIRGSDGRTIRLTDSDSAFAKILAERVQDAKSEIELIGSSVVAATCAEISTVSSINNLRAETTMVKEWSIREDLN